MSHNYVVFGGIGGKKNDVIMAHDCIIILIFFFTFLLFNKLKDLAFDLMSFVLQLGLLHGWNWQPL